MLKFVPVLYLMFSFATTNANPLTPPVPPQLQPLAWSLGNWECVGHYQTVPPFTTSHDDVAVFHVGLDVGNMWLSGQYGETSTTNGAPPTAIHELFTIDATGSGIREFADSNTGRFFGGFVAGPSSTEFTGSYTIFGQSVGFTETLQRGTGDTSFTTDSRVLLPIGPGGALVPVTFHTQTCTKLGSAQVSMLAPARPTTTLAALRADLSLPACNAGATCRCWTSDDCAFADCPGDFCSGADKGERKLGTCISGQF